VWTLIEEVVCAVAMPEIVELPRFLSPDTGSNLFLINENFDRSQISTKVPSV